MQKFPVNDDSLLNIIAAASATISAVLAPFVISSTCSLLIAIAFKASVAIILLGQSAFTAIPYSDSSSLFSSR